MANDPLDRVKRIIRELQNRTTENGCSEAEAMEAARMMGELLAKHELEMSDVGLKAEVKGAKENIIRAADDYASSVVTGIGQFCTLVVYRKAEGRYVLFGMEHDLEIAKYLYEIVCYAMDDEYEVYQTRHGYNIKGRASFRMGFASRICQRLRELKVERDRERMKMSSATDLVVLKDQLVKTEFEKLGIRLVKATKKYAADSNAYHHGSKAGDKVNLNNPLGGPGSKAAIR